MDLVLRAEKRGDAVADAELFLLGRPRLAKELFIAILYQQAFHVATWIFGAWQIGVGDGYGCYYGQSWSVHVRTAASAARATTSSRQGGAARWRRRPACTRAAAAQHSTTPRSRRPPLALAGDVGHASPRLARTHADRE